MATPTNQDQRSSGELVKDLSQQTSELVRQELALAKAEMTEKAKAAGVGIGLFGSAGLVAVLGLAALTAAAILGLAIVLDAWLAALIVGVVYLLVAGVQALIGRSQVQRATPPAPEQTVESVKEDVEWAKTRAKSARK
jgi:hypothetical protein